MMRVVGEPPSIYDSLSVLETKIKIDFHRDSGTETKGSLTAPIPVMTSL